jgi:hypothetical protein
MFACEYVDPCQKIGPIGPTGPIGPIGPPGGPTGPTGPTGPGIWFDNFTFGLNFPKWGKTGFGPALFTSDDSYWLVPGMDDALQGKSINLGTVTNPGPVLASTFIFSPSINNYQVGTTTPRSIAIAYKEMTSRTVAVHLTEIGRLTPNATPGSAYDCAVNGWSQSIALTIHAFCKVDNSGTPSGGATSAVPLGPLIGAPTIPLQDVPASNCQCISIPEISFGCNITGLRKRFLAIELKPIPNSTSNLPSWWQPAAPSGASYSIISRTISVTVKGESSNNPP